MVSVSDLQRDSARVMRLAKSSNDPVIVVKNNKPEAAFVSLKKLQFLIDRITDLETRDALEAIKIGEEERKKDRLITLSDDIRELL